VTPSVELVRVVVVLLTALTVAAALDLTLGTVLRNRRHRRRQRQLDQALQGLVTALDPSVALEAVVAQIRCLPHPVVDEALALTARSFGGADRERVRAVAQALGVPERAWRASRSRSWPKRLRGVRLLSVVSDEVPALALLTDGDAEVRGAAVLWAGLAVGTTRATSRGEAPSARSWSSTPAGAVVDPVPALGDALLDPAALVRLCAKHAIVSSEPPTAAAVERALTVTAQDRGTPLAPVAPLAVAAVLGPRVPLALTTPYLDDPEVLVRASAIRAVAAAAPDRIPALCDVGLGDAAPVRAAVADVAGRDLRAVHHLVTLALDPAWQVRHAARVSLRRLGPVGRVLSRRVQRGPVGQVTEVAPW
jgi:hypothetical protein